MKTKSPILFVSSLCFSTSASASFVSYFKEEDGSTNWQYVANFSSSLLILLLLITSVFLFFNMLRAYRANKALKQIKANLEKIVQDRTNTLNESNQLLKKSNSLLEGEIGKHKDTAARLRSSEAYIKSIVDSMPLMLIGLNEELKVTQWNSWAEHKTGLSIQKVQGKYLWDAYPTITLYPDQVKNVLKKGESVTIKHSQRGQYYFDITLYPLVNQLDTGIVIMVDDVTQQCKASNLLIQKDKFSALGELAAAMAHDINIPLAAIDQRIDGLTKSLETNNLDNNQLLENLNKSSENSRQASAIIRHLIQFSRFENSTKELCAVPPIIDHALIVAESLFSDTQGLKFADIDISRTYAEDLPQIPCHASELQQVCLSIFRHACYALGKLDASLRAPKLTIELSEFYDSLWIKINHNGPGLSDEEQMTIFEPFYQNDDINRGFEMANRLSFPFFIISEHHGGHMAVTSDVNVGTTFHIQLQLK